MQKRCSVPTKPRQRSGSPHRTFLFRLEPPIDLPIMYDCWCVNISNSLWTSCWMCLTWLMAHLISFVRSRQRRHRSLFVYLTFRLCWCILRTQSVALEGGFSRTPHRLFIFTAMNVESTCLPMDNRDSQKSLRRFRFPEFHPKKSPLFWRKNVLERVCQGQGKLWHRKSWSIDTRHIVVLESLRVDSPFVSVITFQLNPTRLRYVTLLIALYWLHFGICRTLSQTISFFRPLAAQKHQKMC